MYLHHGQLFPKVENIYPTLKLLHLLYFSPEEIVFNSQSMQEHDSYVPARSFTKQSFQPKQTVW